MGTVLFRRPARQAGPQIPRGELVLEAPPDLPAPSQKGLGQILMILPMLAGMGAMMFMYAGRGGGNSAIPWITGGLFGISMLGMGMSQFTSGGGESRAALNHARRDYMRYLAQMRKRARKASTQQREALRWRQPEPDSLWSIAASSRLWERRATDSDFGETRVAVGPQKLAVQLVTPETRPVEDLEPMSAIALRRFVRTHATVPDVPMALSVRSFSRLVFRGERAVSMDLVRSMLCQLATFHSPEDLRIAVVTNTQRVAEWSWVKWLPHALHEGRGDAAGPLRTVFSSLEELEDLFGDEVSGRPRHAPDQKPITTQPHLVVVLDGGDSPPSCHLAGRGLKGTTVLDLSGATPRHGWPGLLPLDVTAASVQGVRGERVIPLGVPDRMTLAQAEGLARQLAPYRLSFQTAGGRGDEALNVATELPDLLGVADAAKVDPRRSWHPRPNREKLRIPLGVGPDGVPVDLDIKEAAQEGMGPHGLIIGATGSGKSELLRTIVAALAINHSSEEVNFVLVDFKGGATFASLDVLPHTSAVITNLSDELAMVDRMHDAIAGEMTRRQELLRSAGNYVSRYEYEKARLAGEPLAPLPTLLMICDEFSEMLAAKPDFIDLFVQIGRIGRSIGVHLLLASQRLEEGKLRGLDTYLSYRIGLRTFSAVESRIVLGVNDAYELPNAPGHGYLKSDTTTMHRFRGAYVSGPYRPAGARARSHTQLHRRIVPYDVAYVPVPDPPADVPAPFEAVAAHGKETSMLDVIVDRLRGQGPPAHQVWLPPLSEPPTIAELLPPLVADPLRGLAPAERTPRLAVPVGIVDKPFEQRRDPMCLELDGAGGHVVIVGGPQSGKSTMLRSLLVSLALTHTPREAQFYCVDFGGGTLTTLRDLPHVSGVSTRVDVDGIRRTIAEVTSLLDAREARFTAAGVDSMATYRRRRDAGEFADDPFGDVFLVVDGWGAFKQEYENFEQTFANLGGRGLGFGVHLVLTATRWAEVRLAMRDLFGTKVELRLGDPGESELDRRAAANVPERSPGRGVTKEKLHFLTAIPRMDGRRAVDDLADGVAGLVAAVRAAWPGRTAPKVRLLPERLHVSELPTARAGEGIPIGINETALAPVLLDMAAEPHLIVFGDAECGKSSLLRLIGQTVTRQYPPERARLIVADYRRSLLGQFNPDHLLGYAPSGTALTDILGSVRAAMADRLPGPDVTPHQLRDRSWWHGPDVYLLVDDYDLVAGAGGNPLTLLSEYLPQARDLGLHLIITRRMGGASRALYDPVIQRLRELDCPGLMMSGNRDEGALFGNLKPSQLPPGRGTLIRRRDGANLIQTAWSDPS
ncbi:type VII secretion protein EccC [Longispora fulva]|uniref:S-DNA-T family DNA segregation ATPase FtsK/SpoIIIE n=1 Tax=Longispora fulva TaxID=619741 RepID=A0A8J7KY94_9ACTN|nr:type VII secretion protein EccCa [Longispora fulva]MBG6139022.1 S-DNA-T family DNA segregation ATPase FtsK/SpoIIIE [Longispora fulva]GIG58515.1 type VII secretion protein EccC [Longispora fulva]